MSAGVGHAVAGYVRVSKRLNSNDAFWNERASPVMMVVSVWGVVDE